MKFDKCPIFKYASQSWFYGLIFEKRLFSIPLVFYVAVLPMTWIHITQWFYCIYIDPVSSSRLVINIFLTMEMSRILVSFMYYFRTCFFITNNIINYQLFLDANAVNDYKIERF